MMLSGFVGFAQCKITSKYDKFRKETLFNIPNVKIYKEKNSFEIHFLKTISSDKISYALVFSIPLEGCLSSSESYVEFLYANGNIERLNYTFGIGCGKKISLFSINETQLENLSNLKITDIRIHYDSNFDLEITENMDNLLKENIQCILKANANNQ